MPVGSRYVMVHLFILIYSCHVVLSTKTYYFFQIPIFEKGYEKDPAIVAKEAIQEATRNGSDVVLVDTAGRMQVLEHLYKMCFTWL